MFLQQFLDRSNKIYIVNRRNTKYDFKKSHLIQNSPGYSVEQSYIQVALLDKIQQRMLSLLILNVLAN